MDWYSAIAIGMLLAGGVLYALIRSYLVGAITFLASLLLPWFFIGWKTILVAYVSAFPIGILLAVIVGRYRHSNKDKIEYSTKE